MKKYIKSLDRSRSSRGVKPLREKIGKEENKESGFKKKNKSLNKKNVPNIEKKQNNTNIKTVDKKDNKSNKK